MSGNVLIDLNGNRAPDYILQNFKDGFKDFAFYRQSDGMFVMNKSFSIIFPGGSTDAPIDHPPCGWKGELCLEYIGTLLYNLFYQLKSYKKVKFVTLLNIVLFLIYAILSHY